jgi:hypothetical protein
MQIKRDKMAPEDGKKRKGQAALTLMEAERIVADEVPTNRREQIRDYLRLFGYKPDRTILQVHVAGFFNKRRTASRAPDKRAAAARRYGGTTFVVVGRTHDPSIMALVSKPRKKLEETSPGYVGYLWKNRDQQQRSPHEVIPLDFTPIHVPYPQDWKNMFATKGFMIALHVPAYFAKNKNRLSRALYRAGRNADVKQRWEFIDQVRSEGHDKVVEDPLGILKVRLAKGEINQPEYEKLRQTITA